MRILLIVLICFFIQACSGEPTIPNGHLETVKPQSIANTLYYSGNIQPISSRVVTAPADGVIIEMPFQYGEMVKQNQPLFIISSAKFLTDYKAALMQYVKSKSEFNNAETQLKEADFLHSNELISDDEFKMKQTGFYAGQLALLQAKDVLDVLLKQMDIKDINLNTLTIADIDKVTEALHLQKKSENIRIISPAEGTVLSSGKSEDENKKLLNGDAVKQGDVLAVIGDMKGLSVRIRVNELVVNQLHAGQKVKITGIAFPETTLNGEIARVDHQGESSNGGLPTFSVQVVVPALTPSQQKLIHVGMSSQVAINTSEEAKVLIPINAINETDGKTVVKVYDMKKRRLTDRIVQTGKTTQDAVTIISGLQSGDKIVVPS